MTDVTFGGTTNTPFQSSAGWVRMSISTPAGRTMANGSQAVLITDLLTYVGGYGGVDRAVTTSFAGSSVSYTAAASSNPSGTWRDSSNTLVNPGTYTFQHSGGPFYGKRAAAGTGFTDGQFGDWDSLWAGGYRYVQAPAAPTLSAPTSLVTGQIDVSWSAPGDNGGTSVTGYAVQYATNSGFTGASTVTTGSTSATLTSLTPGATYYVRVAARNAVTTDAGTYGPWTAAQTALVLSGTRVGVAGVWEDAEVYAGVNGDWVPCSVYAGRAGAWVNLTN